MTRKLTGVVLLAWVLAMSTAARADVSSLLAALDVGGYGPGERPPDFVGHTTHGSRVSLAALRGKVVILTFWATWCPPCRPELAMLEGLQRDLRARELAVVAVNTREARRWCASMSRRSGLRTPSSSIRAASSSTHTASWGCLPRS